MTKYTHALDEELKLINREEFFKQFLHPSLRTAEFIDIDVDAKSNIELSKEDIVDIVRNRENVDEENVDEEEGEIKEKEVNIKEAFNSFEIVKSFIENSDFYNANACHLLSQVENLIHDIDSSRMRQTEILDYFKKL